MIINLAGNLLLKTEIPFLTVEQFKMDWQPDNHALLILEGYIHPETLWNITAMFGGQIEVWHEENTVKEVLFNGVMLNIDRKIMTGLEKVTITALSASVLQDQEKHSRSFQNVEKSYYDIIKQVVSEDGGQTICTADKTKKPVKPVIQYEETNWEFARRLASYLKVPLMPDVETGNSAFWIGMRKGETIPSFNDNWYTIKINKKGVQYWVRDLENYKLGDRTFFEGQDLLIFEKHIVYENGELQYYYLLGNEKVYEMKEKYQEMFAGLGLKGVVESIKDELVSIALDIDDGKHTGEYFYEWMPETGSGLYAVAEIGAPVYLYFYSECEQDAIVINCLHRESTKANGESSYKNRMLNILDTNIIRLFTDGVRVSADDVHSMNIQDEITTIRTSEKMEISAEGKIKIKAKVITLQAPEEINTYYG